jgi:hypothetical protein
MLRRVCLALVSVLAVAGPAQAQHCGQGMGNQGQGQGGFNIGGNCVANQADLTTLANQVTTTDQIFNNRFNDMQTQLSNNRLEARRGVAMGMAAAGLGAGAGAAAAAGGGKAALSAGAGEFEGQWSFAAGISYAVNKRLLLNVGTAVTPFAPVPLIGFSAGATLVLN